MSIRLNSGEHFRLLNQAGRDVTNASPLKEKPMTLEIDVDKDGRFDGANDLSFSDSNSLSLILDGAKGNAMPVLDIPFASEIESHVINARVITEYLNEAKTLGLQAKETSIFNSSKKIQLGREAIAHTKEAFYLDTAHPIARFSYGMTIASIKDSFWKSKAEESMQINVDSEAPKVMEALEKDKYDIMGQMMLKRLYELYDKETELTQLNQWLNQLKRDNPGAYNTAEDHYNKAGSHG